MNHLLAVTVKQLTIAIENQDIEYVKVLINLFKYLANNSHWLFSEKKAKKSK